jgi:hypothetical protein
MSLACCTANQIKDTLGLAAVVKTGTQYNKRYSPSVLISYKNYTSISLLHYIGAVFLRRISDCLYICSRVYFYDILELVKEVNKYTGSFA